MTDFILSCEIIEKKTPFIILLGGTSGSGKSTLGSILAALFGISTALSTDSIRQIMRNFYEPSQLPLLFASTYEAGKYLEIPTSSEQNR
jgi:2-phosphoglycerate kinase